MKKFGSTSFEYNAEGLRTKKGNKEYIWSGDRILGEKENGKVTMRYFYDASGIAGYEYSGTKFVFRKNLQGDVIAIIDNSGTLLGTYEYDAWGNCTATKVIISGTSMVLSMNIPLPRVLLRQRNGLVLPAIALLRSENGAFYLS